ncbi:MAG: OmpA family protein [bacterium]
MSRSNIWLIIVLLFALAGWYLYMQEHTAGKEFMTTVDELQKQSLLADEQIRQHQSEVTVLNQQLQVEEGGAVATDEAPTPMESASVESLLKAAEAEIQTLRTKNMGLEALLAEQNSSTTTVSEQLAAGRAEVSDSAQQLALAIKAREELEAALNLARTRAEKTTTLEQQLIAADQEISGRSLSLENERSRVLKLEQELTTLQQGREELESNISVKENRLNQLSAEQDIARDEITRLKVEIEKISKQSELEVKNIRDQVTLIRVGSDIVFELGSTDLKPSGREVLERVAAFSERMPDRIISLEGHTDNVPIAAARKVFIPSNWELSAARAASAARYLEGLGVDPQRLRIIGYGQHRPVAQNDNEAGQRRNRRLEIRLAPAKIFEAAAE